MFGWVLNLPLNKAIPLRVVEINFLMYNVAETDFQLLFHQKLAPNLDTLPKR